MDLENGTNEERLDVGRVAQALQAWLGKSGTVDLARDAPGARITGWIMHPAFTGVDRATRQDWLWKGTSAGEMIQPWSGLRAGFGEQASQIGLILTFSPIEYENAFGEMPKTA